MLNDFLAQTRRVSNYSETMLDIRPHIICENGLILSVQASAHHCCTPRNNDGPYSAVEIGYPSKEIPELLPYAEDKESPTSTVYGYVPIELVEEIIRKAGGIRTIEPRSRK